MTTGRSPRQGPSPAATPPGTSRSWPKSTRPTVSLSGPATKEVLRRQYEIHGDERFRRLASISNGHIYNLRNTRSCRRGRLTFRQTRSTSVRIGQRRKPTPDGRPGHVRVDTVHLGDREGRKGIYVINVVDEVTRFQHLGAVPNITEYFLIPLLEALTTAFPFTVEAFHADNGSEYINHCVAELLTKLHIGTFTKSRPRRSNDNALVESRNGSVVRKWLGHIYVPGPLAPRVNAFLRDTLFPFLNFHRPCLLPIDVTGATGRVKKRCPQARVTTPYDRLRSLPGAKGFLRPATTFEALDQLALATTRLRSGPGRPARPRRAHAHPRKGGPRLRRLIPDRSGPSHRPGSRPSGRELALLL